ncbi:MAG TPA: ATP-binding protein [Candidatus Babeliales bacterium]|nr:ATP-binding protein [Candidatus Babeliales bacterium]
MKRERFLNKITAHFRVHPVCALLGPRQVGKTTLAKMYIQKHFPQDAYFFDLENSLDLERLQNPMLALENISQQLIVIDEIQRRPDLFPILRILVDATRVPLDEDVLLTRQAQKRKKRFLILGSASRDLIMQSSETLAGRIGYIELPPFSLSEVHNSAQLWLRGGFPNSYLAENDADSYLWRQSYITTFLERDIPSLGFNIPAPQMRRFWLMLAHYHGQIFNASELGRSLGVSDHTVRKYLDILAGTFMIRELVPWFENLQKRQVKSPKIYFRDSGILNALLELTSNEQLHTHPRLGAFWEGFALEEIIAASSASAEECYFWSTQADAELDLLILKNNKRIGFELKYTDAPKITKSMRIALVDLKLDHLIVVYPGAQTFPLSENITVYGLEKITQGDEIEKLFNKSFIR